MKKLPTPPLIQRMQLRTIIDYSYVPSEDWYFKRLTISSGAVGATGQSSSAVRHVG